MVPESAYKGKIAINNAAGTPIVHKKAVLQSTLAVMKERFYVDRWLPINNGDGTPSYIGIIYPGSTNWAMHAANRRGNGGTALGTWLNDPLRTLGFSDNMVFSDKKVGSITVSPTLFRSSYYDASSDFGFEYLLAGAWVNWISYGGMSEGVQTTRTHTVESVYHPARAGDPITFRSYIVNPEGKFVSFNTTTIILEAAPLTLKFNDTYASFANDGSWMENIWTGFLPIGVGTRFYSDSNLNATDLVLAGYYIRNGFWYEVRNVGGYMEVVAYGLAQQGSYPSGDPGNLFPDRTQWIGYKIYETYEYPDKYNQCIINHNGADRIYYNPDNGIYYEEYSRVTGLFNTPFTGIIIRSEDCVGLQYSSGHYIGTYP